MRVIGFDPSIVHTGYAILDGGRLVMHGVIEIPPMAEGQTIIADRLCFLMEEVEKLIVTYQPKRAAVEMPPPFSYSRSTDKSKGKALNTESIQKNMAATGVIAAVLRKNGIQVQERYAHEWKTDRGRGMNKATMISLARSTFPVLKNRSITDHEADAICLAALI